MPEFYDKEKPLRLGSGFEVSHCDRTRRDCTTPWAAKLHVVDCIWTVAAFVVDIVVFELKGYKLRIVKD
jgi:hypothetical protein